MNLSGNYTLEFFRDAKKIMAEESYRQQREKQVQDKAFVLDKNKQK